MILHWRAWRTLGPGLAVAVVLAACGGGGGGDSGSTASPGGGPAQPPAAQTADGTPAPATGAGSVDSRTVAGRCAAPRPGTWDAAGTLDDEKRWVRAWIDETYLWYDEVPARRAADYAGPVPYFDALKTTARTPSGRPKDRFHFTVDTASYEASSQGLAWGYGIQLAFQASQPPRDVRVAYVEPGSPAEAAGVARGMRLRTVDGIEVADSADVDGMNAGLAPAAPGERHSLGFRRQDGSDVVLDFTSAAVNSAPVMNVKALPTASGPVGYLQFNQHSIGAEAQLIDAMAELRDAGVTDLVIDMRYNGGGLLGIASELASMVAPVHATAGQTFERLITNRKNPFGWRSGDARMPFYQQATYGERKGDALPRLNLSRVLVLAGGATCSASESVVNGLRGVGVRVDLVGAPTCGKPYGFFPQDNCGTTYFAIQVQGVNARNEGDYADGFQPTCEVADDFAHALGDPAEARLAAALALRSSGRCPVPVVALAASAPRAAAGVAKASGPALLGRRPPFLDNRILLPQDLARD